MSGTKEQLIATNPDAAIYFALGFAAAFAVVGIAWGVSAFSLWRLKAGGISDLAALIRLAGACAIGEFIAVAQSTNLVFVGLRRNDDGDLDALMNGLIPAGAGSVITVTFALLTFSTLVALRRELAQIVSTVAVMIARGLPKTK